MSRRVTCAASAFMAVVLLFLAGQGCEDQKPETDRVPPADVRDLAMITSTDSSLALGWTAPGDDSAQGTAHEYDLRYSFAAIAESAWSACIQVQDEPRPREGGERESLLVQCLEPDTVYYFGLKAVDEAGNWSGLSNVPACTTKSPDEVPPGNVTDLVAGNATPTSVELTWTSPGDDGNEGTASAYDIRYSTSQIEDDNWGYATRVLGEPDPQVAGSAESFVVTGLEPRTPYCFALKSVDESSNWSDISNVRIVETPPRSCPELTVNSAAFGRRVWSGWTLDTEEYEAPVGGNYELRVSGDAGYYGGTVGGFSFGWDLDDLESPETRPDGIGAWTPWAETGPTIYANFSEQRDYFLYINCKDTEGGFTLAMIRFNVVPYAPDKPLAYVDDWRMYPKTGINGETGDDLSWQLMLGGYDYGYGWDDRVWDEWDAPLGEEIPPLDFLLQFRTVVWSINDNRMIPPDSKSAWFTMNYLNTANALALYLESVTAGGEKGKLWAFGRGMVESSVLPYGSNICAYPFDVREDGSINSCSIRRGSFAYDYLHLRGDFVKSNPASGGCRVSLFSEPLDRMQYVDVNSDDLPIEGYSTPPAAELFPTLPPRLEPDMGKYRASTMVYYEVLEYPEPDQETQLLFYDAEHGGETGLVPLYRFSALNGVSRADGKYCGFRYVPSGALDHGEIVYFFFSMYPIYDDQARATAKVVLSEWFGLPDPDGLGARH